MKEIIAAGENVDAIDSSGWTALMYAAANYGSNSDPVQLLLKAGANPNHRSLSGDTPLMAAAAGRIFDEDLWQAGGDVNARNSQGATPLMILAAGGDADEVKDALAAGADAAAKDSKGRSALDYLRLANCGKNPVSELQFLETGRQCDNFDKDEVREITKLLRPARRKLKH
jgi:cytohesin